MASINPFLPVQEGTGTPSPENVRPIKPAVSIAGGKNLLNPDDVYDGYVKTDDSIGSASQWHYTDYLKVTDEYTYTVSGSIATSTPAAQFVFYNESKSKISSIHSGPSNFTFIPPTGTKYVRLSLKGDDPFQLEEGSEPTAYEPYQSLDIYGGYLDIANSMIVEEYKIGIFDGSDDENWLSELLPSGTNFYFWGTDMSPKGAKNQYTNNCNTVCNQAELRTSGQTYAPNIFYFDSNANLNINLGATLNITTVQEFKTYLSEHQLEVAYKLATPTTYYLSSTQLAQAMEQLGIKLSSTLINIRRKILLNSPHLETVSGSVATFDTDMKAKLKECKLHFLPIQEGSGDPSPNNVRPITGWTGFNAYQVRSDILDITYRTGETESYAVKFNVDSYGKITANGTPTSYSSRVFADIAVEGTEILRGRICGNLNNISSNGTPIYDSNWNRITSTSDPALLMGINLSDYEGAKYVACAIKRSINDIPMSGSCFVAFTKDGSSPDLNTIPIAFPSEAGTLYGGYVDLASGELVATYGFIHLSGSENWLVESSVASDSPNRASIKLEAGTGAPYRYPISDKFAPAFTSHPLLGHASINNNNRVIIATGTLSTKQEVQEWIANMGGFDVCWELFTPIYYSITPQQIKTLIGRNNIWSDAGDVEVKYWTHKHTAISL